MVSKTLVPASAKIEFMPAFMSGLRPDGNHLEPDTMTGAVEGRAWVPARTGLVIGAARSGKSAYAQALVEADGRPPIYVATAEVYDDEMRTRVTAHRAARDARWRTAEAPLDLVATLGRLSAPDTMVLVDCLTLWLTNVMLAGHDVDAAVRDLAAMVPTLGGPVLFVSNEVGAGIVPDNRLARDFRDAQGRLNQIMAQACDAVVLVAAGLPLRLKPAEPPHFDFSTGMRPA